ncbi:hypothetical protein [Sphingomonas sp. ABOLG]|uniref:hypothetical protein n=2 Tax=Sphingomonas TaxID=13687 RepID=UPI0013DDA95B|nr:hypothetical protein [Sphingomonas sp. ABOLG]
MLSKVIRRMKFGSGCQRRAYAKDTTMFLQTIDAHDRHQVLIDDRNGFYLLFADTHEVGLGRSFTPHWVGEMADRRTLEAAVRWFARRRDRWQAWGALAKAVGHATFDRHMRALIAAEPFETVSGTFVHIAEDPCEILLGKVLDGSNGTRQDVLHQHRFTSAAARQRFCTWFDADRNFEQIGAIVLLGYQTGAVAVATALDDIARDAAAAGVRARRKRHC